MLKYRAKIQKIEDPLERWIEGCYIEFTNIRGEKQKSIVTESGCQNLINENTLSIFSSLYDKNNTEIFTGDKIRLQNDYIAIVEFHKGMFCFKIDECSGYTPLYYVNKFCKVVGNIYE